MDSDLIARIRGASEVVGWFGTWPSFHDAEILAIHLERELHSPAESWLRLQTWRMRDEIDAKGYYVTEKHCTVTFFLGGVADLELTGFSIQNVIGALGIQQGSEGLRLTLWPCYGLSGWIEAERIRVEFEPAPGS